MVTWYSSIPQPTDLISNSQPQILANNTSINSIFNDATNGNFTKYLLQNVGTIASVIDPISALHAINGTGVTFNGHPLPYFKNSVGDYPMIPDLKATGTDYSFQIGNMIVKFGSQTGCNNNTNINYTTAFPTAQLAAVVSGALSTGTQPTMGVKSSTIPLPTDHIQLKIAGPTPVNVFYLAIGY